MSDGRRGFHQKGLRESESKLHTTSMLAEPLLDLRTPTLGLTYDLNDARSVRLRIRNRIVTAKAHSTMPIHWLVPTSIIEFEQ
jgi:hypothetical protein